MRYALFAGEIYEPNGGMNDYQGSFDTVEQAVSAGTEKHDDSETYKYDWYHILDRITFTIVEQDRNQ